MEERSIFLNLSPLDHRYLLANRELFESLSLYLSEEAGVRYSLRCEVELLLALMEEREGGRPEAEVLSELQKLPELIPPEEIYREEAKTHHNIRALVNVLKTHVPVRYRPLVHLGATSADILETSAALRIRDAVREVILPRAIDLVSRLCGIAEQEAKTPQIGRTHGQHAVPITFGFAVAEYVSRLGKSVERMERKSADLRGKLSGAVGAYNALSLVAADPGKLEKRFLHGLGLEPSEHSTQIAEPEHLLELLLEVNTAFGILANLADDLRNLQRTEIGEVREHFSSSQVGSSTMPQKRNPWNSEHVKSLWKAFAPRIVSFCMDQISEHQRDLTNSASSRFVADYLAGFAAALNRMGAVLASLEVDRERMLANLRSTGGFVAAEPLYILLSLAGEADAHEAVRRLTLEAEKSGKPLADVLKESGAYPKLKDLGTPAGKGGSLGPGPGASVDDLLDSPETYAGLAAAKAARLARLYRKKMNAVSKRLTGGK